MARLECSLDVTEEHVREAVRLLGGSIMKVHQSDLEVDQGGNLVETKDETQAPAAAEQAGNKMVEVALL